MVGSINNKNRKDYGDSLLILVTLVTLSRKLKEAVRFATFPYVKQLVPVISARVLF